MCPKHLRLLAYSLGHFWVDFSCALLMFSRLSGQSGWALCVLLYNFCAFALQMPVGLLADRWERKGRTAALGCGLAALGWVLPPFLAAVIAGVGNACFHVGGGIQVLNDGGDRAAPLGVFVSPGAFGIFFGTLLGSRSAFPGWLTGVGLLLFALSFVLLRTEIGDSLEDRGLDYRACVRPCPGQGGGRIFGRQTGDDPGGGAVSGAVGSPVSSQRLPHRRGRSGLPL